MESDAGKDGSRKRMYKKCYDVEKLKKYVNEGKLNVEIAYLLDISVATVIAGVKAYGLKGMRKRGRPKKENSDECTREDSGRD